MKQNGINITSLKQMLFNNHTEANRRKIKGLLPLDHVFGLCKTSKNVSKSLGFHSTLKTNDLQDIIFTTIAGYIIITINSLNLFVPVLIPNTETQAVFNVCNKNNITISYDPWYTEQKLSTLGNELQVDIGSAQLVNSPKNLADAFQTLRRIGAHNKEKNIASFDHVNVKKYFAEIVGYRYPKDAVLTNFPENEYLNQYRDLNLFYTEYVGEKVMNPFISYTDMKNKYPIQVIDLSFQVDQITPKKIQLFEEFNTDPANVNSRLFVKLIRHRQVEMISESNKLVEINVILKKIVNFKDFMKQNNLENDTLNEFELQRIYNYNIYPRDSKIYFDKGFVNKNNGSQRGSL